MSVGEAKMMKATSQVLFLVWPSSPSYWTNLQAGAEQVTFQTPALEFYDALKVCCVAKQLKMQEV